MVYTHKKATPSHPFEWGLAKTIDEKKIIEKQ